MTVSNLPNQKMYVATGSPGTGKTTIALALAKKFNKRLIVVDVENNPSYDFLTTVPVQDVPYYSQKDSFRIITTEPELALHYLNLYHANAFIICEDAGNYIQSNLHNDVERFLKAYRHRKFDVLLMFHYLQEVPPAVIKYYTFLILFKTADSVELKLRKYPNWHKIQPALIRILAHKNYNYYEIIAAK